MPLRTSVAPPRSLDSILPDETLEIRCILFDGVREHCRAAGLRPGDRVRCVAVTGSRLLLETATGRAAQLDRRWARFVEVAEARAVRRLLRSA